MASLKEQVVRADKEKADSKEIVAEARKESEQRMVRLNVPLVGRNRAENLTRLLTTKSVNSFDADVSQLGHDAVNRLQHGLIGAYSTVGVPSAVALTQVSVAVVTSIRWKGEGFGDDEELEPVEGRHSKTRYSSANTARPRGSGQGRIARR